VQEWMGHRDSKTTGIYADYMPGKREADLVDSAFAPAAPGEAARKSRTSGPARIGLREKEIPPCG